MTKCLSVVLVIFSATGLRAQSSKPGYPEARREAEYYVSTYARHYRVPVPLVRAIIQRESDWRPCAVSAKGAKGLMQLMPETARRLGVRDSFNVSQNISGGVRYLAWLMRLFHNDFRLVAAGYYAGEDIVARRGLSYRNADVIAYVKKIRATYVLRASVAGESEETTARRVVR